MPVNNTSADYDIARPTWERIRAAMSGADAICAGGTKFLPMLTGMTTNDYDRYKLGAKWYAATSQTVAMLAGMINRKEPVIAVPDHMTDMLKDADLAGTPLASLIGDLAVELVSVGRAGLLVDVAGQSAKARPYLTWYKAEDIISATESRIDGATVTTRVVLNECRMVIDPSDEFAVGNKQRFRVLDLFDGAYRQRVFEQAAEGAEYVVVEEVFPKYRGKSLDRIPFVFANSTGHDAKISVSPMQSLCALNFYHYLISADYGWGIHFSCLPTFWVTGFDSAEQRKYLPTTIGPTVIWGLPSGQTAGTLEFTGQSLAEVREALEQCKREMADMGARIIETQAQSGVAAKTVQLKQSAEGAMLAQVANSLGRAVDMLLRISAEWIGADPEAVSVTVNSDFVPTDMDPAMLRELVAGVQAGEISRQEFFAAIKAGEIVADSKTYDEHAAEIEEDNAARGLGGAPDQFTAAITQAAE